MKKQHFAAALILMIFMLAIFPAHGETVSMNVSGVPNLTLSVDPTGKAEGFSAIVYNNPNGLPTSEANAIAETSEGFIWIGSYAGLIRYDGNTFERIDSTTGIASVRSLYVDSGDRLWIGTNDSGLFLMTKGELYHWDKAEGLKSSSVRTITEDAEGNICAGSTAGIAVIDKELKLSDLSDERIVSQTIRELRRGADGLVYGLTSAGDLFTLKGGEVRGLCMSGRIRAGSGTGRRKTALGTQKILISPRFPTLKAWNASTARSGSAPATGSGMWTHRVSTCLKICRWTTP